MIGNVSWKGNTVSQECSDLRLNNNSEISLIRGFGKESHDFALKHI